MQARYFDGQSAKSEQVDVRLRDGGLSFQIGPKTYFWSVKELKAQRDHANGLVIEQTSTGAYMQIADPSARLDFKKRYPSLFKVKLAQRDRSRLFWWGGGTLAAIFALIFMILPRLSDALAYMMPRDKEVALGRQLIEGLDGSPLLAMMDISGLCTDEAGMTALLDLRDQLSSKTDLDYDIEIYVVDSPILNAFTFPGGQVVFTKGLIEAADGPNEVAAVLGHEIGHAESRDPLRIMFSTLARSSILSILIGDAAGGIVTYAVLDTLLNAKYSQGAEWGADGYALKMLEMHDISGAPLASFFEKLLEDGGDTEGLSSHFSSHPELKARIASALKSVGNGDEDTQLINEAAWKNLQNVCAQSDPFERSRILKFLDRFSGDGL